MGLKDMARKAVAGARAGVMQLPGVKYSAATQGAIQGREAMVGAAKKTPAYGAMKRRFKK